MWRWIYPSQMASVAPIGGRCLRDRATARNAIEHRPDGLGERDWDAHDSEMLRPHSVVSTPAATADQDIGGYGLGVNGEGGSVRSDCVAWALQEPVVSVPIRTGIVARVHGPGRGPPWLFVPRCQRRSSRQRLVRRSRHGVGTATIAGPHGRRHLPAQSACNAGTRSCSRCSSSSRAQRTLRGGSGCPRTRLSRRGTA